MTAVQFRGFCANVSTLLDSCDHGIFAALPRVEKNNLLAEGLELAPTVPRSKNQIPSAVSAITEITARRKKCGLNA